MEQFSTTSGAWYEEWFGSDYAAVYAHRNEAEAHTFIDTLERKLSLKPGMHVLDLCCGAGRYAHILAQRGLEVIGLDLSEQLVHRARQRADEIGVNVDFIVQDMREIPYSDYFDLILNMFTSFGYFDTDAENGRVVAAASRALKKGGWMVLDFMNRDYILDNFNLFDEMIRGDITIRQHRTFDESTNRINKDITFIRNGTVRQYRESVRLYSPGELEHFFTASGLIPVTRYGDYSGNRFTAASVRFILIGRKR